MPNFIIFADSFRNPVIGPTIRHRLGRLPSCCSGIYYPLSPGFCGLKVQLLGEMPVPGDQKRMELVTLTCEDQTEYEAFKGQTVTVPLGIFAPARGQIIYFIPKGAHPVPALASVAQPVEQPVPQPHKSPVVDDVASRFKV